MQHLRGSCGIDSPVVFDRSGQISPDRPRRHDQQTQRDRARERSEQDSPSGRQRFMMRRVGLKRNPGRRRATQSHLGGWRILHQVTTPSNSGTQARIKASRPLRPQPRTDSKARDHRASLRCPGSAQGRSSSTCASKKLFHVIKPLREWSSGGAGRCVNISDTPIQISPRHAGCEMLSPATPRRRPHRHTANTAGVRTASRGPTRSTRQFVVHSGRDPPAFRDAG
jgi:hypothetical protein